MMDNRTNVHDEQSSTNNDTERSHDVVTILLNDTRAIQVFALRLACFLYAREYYSRPISA